MRTQRQLKNRNLASKAKKWTAIAIDDEDQKPKNRRWRNEPSLEFQRGERLKRTRFCRKHAKTHPELHLIADCLEQCELNNRCYSGACPECGSLFQRFFVRKAKRVIRDIISPEGNTLFAVSIIPGSGLVQPGKLSAFSIDNFVRRIKSALDRADVMSAIGGVDISFNESREDRWPPITSVHLYLIVATDDKRQLSRCLKAEFSSSRQIPRPIHLSAFDNNSFRRSYSLKTSFKRRISNTKPRKEDARPVQDTSPDRPRVDQRIELYLLLHKVGLSARVFFRGVKPEVAEAKVRFRRA